MNHVMIDKRSFLLPSTWNELSSWQVLLVAGLFTRKLSAAEFKLRALFGFLRIRPAMVKKIHPEDACFLSHSLDFLLKEVDLTRNPLPQFRLGLRKFYGPSDGLLNCTFGEFTRACSLFEAYSASKEEAFLDEMVAVLFRPRKWFWNIRRYYTDDQDCRKRFVRRTLSKRSARFSTLCPGIKNAAFLFFSGVLASLPRQFPFVYGQKETDGNSENNWATLIISLAEGRTDDESLEKITGSNLYNVLIGLNKKAKEYKEYQSKIESHDRHR